MSCLLSLHVIRLLCWETMTAASPLGEAAVMHAAHRGRLLAGAALRSGAPVTVLRRGLLRARLRSGLGRAGAPRAARAATRSGGTGLAPRDRTPEATRAVLEFEVPGLAELMRAEGVKKNPKAALSRGLAGVRGRTLLINLPGSPKGAKESLAAVLDILPHAIDTLRAEKREAPADWHQ